MMSSNAVNTNSCCVGGSGGSSGGKNKRRRTEITLENSDENHNTDALLELGKERLKAAQAALALAQQNVEDLRQLIRSSGRYEVDSLLRLGQDDLFHIMCFLDVNDVGRCAMVCHALNNHWESFEARLLTHDSLRSPSATNSRERVVRYVAASKFAAQIGELGENIISKHTIILSRQNNIIDSPSWYKRVDDHCTGCILPDLNIDMFDHNGVLSDEYELFVRLSRSSDNKLYTEGFVSNDHAKISLNGLDFSAWPEALELKRIMISLGDEFGNEDHHIPLLRECMSELTVVLLAVNKTTLKTALIAVHSGFGRGDTEIELDGHYVDCYPTGYLSVFSHRPFHGDRMVQVELVVTDGVALWEKWELLIEVMSGHDGESVIFT